MNQEIVQLVRALSRYIKVADSIPSQSPYKKQPMNAEISGTTNDVFLSLSVSQMNKKKKIAIEDSNEKLPKFD